MRLVMEHLNAAQICASRYVHYTYRQEITASLVSILFISREIRRDLEHILNTINNLSPMLNPESFEAQSSIAFSKICLTATITMNLYTV